MSKDENVLERAGWLQVAPDHWLSPEVARRWDRQAVPTEEAMKAVRRDG
jgi:hypothetical protein